MNMRVMPSTSAGRPDEPGIVQDRQDMSPELRQHPAAGPSAAAVMLTCSCGPWQLLSYHVLLPVVP